MSSLSYKVLYLDRAVRTEHGGTYSLDEATKLLKALKRRGFTGWIETSDGHFVPVTGAMRMPAHRLSTTLCGRSSGASSEARFEKGERVAATNVRSVFSKTVFPSAEGRVVRHRKDGIVTVEFHDPEEDAKFLVDMHPQRLVRLSGRSAGKVYEYVLLLRPFGFATVPSGHIGFRKSFDLKRYPHGVVQYDKPLSRRDIEAFDLMPLDPFDPLNVRRVITAWRDRVRERFIEGNREMFNVEDDDSKGFRLLTYSTRPGVEFQVTFFTRGRAGKARPEPTGHLDFNDFDKAADSMLTKKARKEIVDAIVPRA